MKVLILGDSEPFGELYIRSAFVVPDDLSLESMKNDWLKECVVPVTGKNQHGAWTSKSELTRTKTFEEWVKDNYDEATFEYEETDPYTPWKYV